MKYFFLVLVAFFSVCLFAETVVKSSVPFKFPTGIGVKHNASLQSRDLSLSYKVHPGSKSIIGLSWSLPEKAPKGAITIYTLAGAKVKSFPVNAQKGIVNWDLAKGAKMANGVYFATMKCGEYTKNLKILLSR